MNDLIIRNGVVVTMDPDRRIIDDGAVVVKGDRIIAVGTTDEILATHTSKKQIDASRKVVMPGMIDGHAHAGHALVKSMATDGGVKSWQNVVYHIYQTGSDEEFWYAEAQLSALERLKFGVTTSVNYLGGGDQVMRTDDPAYGNSHCEAIQKVGIREFLAVGPGKASSPKRFVRWRGESHEDYMVTLEKELQVSEELIHRWHRKNEGKISICVALPVFNPSVSIYSKSDLQIEKTKAHETRALSKKHGLLFTQDGHRRGTVQFAHEEFGILGSDTFLSHCIDITAEEIDICRQTGAKVVHNPSSIFSMLGRCPAPELIDAGVTVFLGSDGAAPNRSYDMFRHMAQCMRLHRTYFRDIKVLPPGKVLEMATIDAAKGLGLEKEIGSLEPGKKADIILIDMYKPHLYPFNMPIYRLLWFASGADVDTVLINGDILMEGGVVNTVKEDEVLDLAQAAADKAIDRVGLRSTLMIPDGFWGRSRYS